MTRPPEATPVACIALGSNLGDRRAHIAGALDRIAATPGVGLRAVSTIIETDPVGPAGQQPYLNAAASVETTLEPRALLDALLAIEREHGRERRERWGPRTLDLDILLYADRVVDEPDLHIPHPRMRDRLFVLVPLAEIEPDAVDPVTGQTVRALLASARAAAPEKPR